MAYEINADTVNIIIPIYNVEKYLLKCINSALNQTYEKLRIILVDDGSTDGCPLICDEYAKKDERICVIHKKNGGLSDARNAGLEYLQKNKKGGYIYFLDSDDYIEKNLVEKCVNVIKEYSCDVVILNYVHEDEFGKPISYSIIKQGTFNLKTDEQKLKHISSRIVHYYTMGWSSCSRFYKTDIILDNNILYPDNRKVFAEDLAFNIRVALYQKKVVAIDDCLYHYVRRQNSIMESVKIMPYEKFIYLCSDFEEYAIKNGYGDLIKKEGPFIFSRILLNEILKIGGNLQRKTKIFVDQITKEKDLKLVQMWFREASRHKLKLLSRNGFIDVLQICIIADELTDKKLRKNKLYIILQKIWNLIKK